MRFKDEILADEAISVTDKVLEVLCDLRDLWHESIHVGQDTPEAPALMPPPPVVA